MREKSIIFQKYDFKVKTFLSQMSFMFITKLIYTEKYLGMYVFRSIYL